MTDLTTSSIGDAAREIGVSIDTLRRWDREGKLTVLRSNGQRRIPRSEVERLRRPHLEVAAAAYAVGRLVADQRVVLLLEELRLITLEKEPDADAALAAASRFFGLTP